MAHGFHNRICTTLILLAACWLTGAAASAQDANLRALHLSPDAPNVDVFVNGSGPAISDLAFGEVTAFSSLTPGEYFLDVVPSGAPLTSSVLTLSTSTLASGASYTAVAYGSVADLQGTLIADTLAATPGFAAVTLGHVAEGIGRVDILALAPTGNTGVTTLLNDVAFGDFSPSLPLPPGDYRVGLDLNGDNQVEFAYTLPTVSDGDILAVFAVREGDLIAIYLLDPIGNLTRVAPEAALTSIRVVHLSPDAPNVDIYVNGSGPVIANLPFESASAFLQVAPGTYTFDVVPTGAPPASSVLTLAGVQLSTSSFYTAVAYDEVLTISGLALEDELTSTPAGLRLRAIHTASGVGRVDVLALSLAGGVVGSELFTDLDFGAAGAYAVLPAAAARVGLDVDDDGRADLTFLLPALEPGSVANVYAVNDLSDIYLLVQLQDSTLVRIDAEAPTAGVRVGHFSPDAPNVDIYANGGGPVLTDIAFGSASPYLDVTPGTYTFDVVPAGKPIGDSVLTLTSVTLANGEFLTAVAYDELAVISGLALADDLFPAPVGVRLRVVHTVVGVGPVDVLALGAFGLGGSPLFADVDFGSASGYLELPAGAYRIGLDVDDDGLADLTFQLPALAAGSVANIFAQNATAGAAVSLLVQLQDDVQLPVAAEPAPAGVRAVHLSPDAPTVDLLAEGLGAVVAGLDFPGGSTYTAVPPTTYTLSVVPTGLTSASSVLDVAGVSLAGDRSYSVVAFDRLSSGLMALLLEDDLSATSQTRVRAVHTAPGVGEVDVLALPPTGAIGSPLFADLGFGGASTTTLLAPGAYRVGLDLDNNLGAELTYKLPTLNAGDIVNLYAFPFAASVALFAHYADGTTGVVTAEPAPSAAAVRVLHLSPDAPDVDVFANGAGPVVSDLTFLEGGPFLQVPAGVYTFDVSAAGQPSTDSVLTAPNVPLEAGSASTVVAFDTLAAISGLVLDEDLTTPTGARLRAVHAATGVGQVDILTLPPNGRSGSGLFSDLDFGTASSPAEVPAAPYRVGIDVDNDLLADLIFQLPALSAGDVVNIYAVNDLSAVFLLLQFADGQTVRVDVEPPRANVRGVHLSPDAPAVDLLADGLPLLTNIDFPDATTAIDAIQGTYTLSVVPTGLTSASSVLDVAGVSLAGDRNYSVVAFDRLSSGLMALLLEDDLSATSQTRVRAVHTAPGVGEVDVLALPSDGPIGAPLFENLAFGQASTTTLIAPGAPRIGLDLDNNLGAELTYKLPALGAGTVANLYAFPFDAGVALFGHLDDGTTLVVTAEPAPPAADLRVVHLSPDAPAVDVFANGAGPVVSNLPFLNGTGFLSVGAGIYEFAVAATGRPSTDSVLNVPDVRIEPGQVLTVVAYDALSQIAGLLLEDDLSTPAGIRVRAIHTAAGIGQVDVLALGATGVFGPPVFSDLDFGTATAYAELDPGAYRLGLDLNDDGAADVSFQTPDLPAGTIANIFAVLDGAPLLFVQLQDGTTLTLTPEAAPQPAQVRALHLSPDAGQVDFFANESGPQNAAPLVFQSGTPFLPLAPGVYDFDFAPAGQPPALAVLSVDNVPADAADAFTLVAFDTFLDIKGLLLQEDLTTPTGYALRVIHTARDVGRVDILQLGASGPDGLPFLFNLAFGEASVVVRRDQLPPRVGLDLNDDYVAELSYALPTLPAGTRVNVYATNNGGDIDLVAQLDDGTVVVLEAEPPQAGLRGVHLSPDAPAVDIYVDGLPAFSGLGFQNATPFADLDPGTYTLDIVPAGAPLTSSVLTVPNLGLEAGELYSAVAFDLLADIQPLALVEDFSLPLIGGPPQILLAPRIRAAHTAVGVGEVDVLALPPAGRDGLPLFENLGFGGVSQYTLIDSGAPRVGLDTDNDLRADLVYQAPELIGGQIANLFAVSEGATVTLFVNLDDGTTAVLKAQGPSAYLRGIHLAPSVGAVDIYANGELDPALAGLEFTRSTPFVLLPAGTYTFDVVPAGQPLSASVLNIPSIPLSEDVIYTAAAYEAFGVPQALLLTEQLAVQNGARIRAVHAADGVSAVDVLRLERVDPAGELVFDNLDFGTDSDYATLPPGSFSLGLDLDQDLISEFVFQVPRPLANGDAINAYAVNTADGVRLIVQDQNGATVVVEPYRNAAEVWSLYR